MVSKSLWLLHFTHSIKGKAFGNKVVNVCNLQLVNGFLADPRGMQVFCLSSL